MPDELLLDPSTFSEFVDAAGRGFGAVVGWDMPVEVDIPLEESWRNLVACLRRTLELAARLDVPVIPLSKGVCEEQVRAYLGALERLGFRVAALHASEYAWRLFEEGLARRLLDLHLREMLERFEQVLVIGVLSPDRLRYVMERYDSPKVSYSGISWLLDAKEGYAYARWSRVDLKRKSLVVRSGRGVEVLEYPWKVREIASHNLDYVLNVVRGARRERGELHDLALAGRTLVVSDVHLGVPESMREEFLKALRAEDPENVIFLGDTFDLVRGYELVVDVVNLFGELAWVSPRILVVRGDDDQQFSKVLEVMDDGLLYMSSSRILPRPRRPTNYHLLAFYKFYRFALDDAVVMLPSGETAYMLHGHRLGRGVEAVLSEVRKLGDRLRSDWVFVAHTHKPLLDRKLKVANPGCWLKSIEGAGSYIVIEKDGSIELVTGI